MEPVEAPRKTTHGHGFLLKKPFTILFLLHLLIVAVLVAALLIHGFLISPDPRHHFHPLQWFLPIFASIAAALISSFSWLLITRLNPSGALKSALWSAPCLVLATGIVLVMSGSPADLGVGVVAIVFAVALSVYGCSVIPHLRHAVRIMKICSEFSPPGSVTVTVAAVNASAVYSCFLVGGIGGARAGSIGGWAALILISLGWTMQVMKNVVGVGLSRAHHLKFLQDIERIDDDVDGSLRERVWESMEAICLGSLLVPVIGLVRGLARAMEAASGGSDEFMFSCNHCYSSIASRMIRHVNRWGFVHVGAYGKGIMQASRDTWELFERANLLSVIDSDITNSFYFLSGVAGGSLSSLVAGIWAFVVHKGYTTEVSVYAFFIGYLLTRIALAWPQSSLLAYYVAYSENPDCVHFDGSIEIRMHELQTHQPQPQPP